MNSKTKSTIIKEQLLFEVLVKLGIKNLEDFNEEYAIQLIDKIQDEVDRDFDCNPKTFTNYFNTKKQWSDNWGYLAAYVLGGKSEELKKAEKKDQKRLLRRYFDEYKNQFKNSSKTQSGQIDVENVSGSERRAFGRREFLILGGGIALTSGCGYYFFHRRRTKYLEMRTAWANNYYLFPGRVVKQFIDELNEKSDGNYEIILPPTNLNPRTREYMDPSQLLNALEGGEIHILHGSPYYFLSKKPIASLFSAVPFGRNQVQKTQWLTSKKDVLKNLFKSSGITTYFGGMTGGQDGGWYVADKDGERPKNTQYFQGKKIRFGGLAKEVLEKCGATIPRNIYQNDIFESMNNGEINIGEWLGGKHDFELGLQTTNFKYYNTDKWNEPSSAFAYLFSEESLSVIGEEKIEETINDFFSLPPNPTTSNIDKTRRMLFEYKRGVIPESEIETHLKRYDKKSFKFDQVVLDYLKDKTVIVLKDKFKKPNEKMLLDEYVKGTPLDGLV